MGFVGECPGRSADAPGVVTNFDPLGSTPSQPYQNSRTGVSPTVQGPAIAYFRRSLISLQVNCDRPVTTANIETPHGPSSVVKVPVRLRCHHYINTEGAHVSGKPGRCTPQCTFERCCSSLLSIAEPIDLPTSPNILLP